MISKKNNSKNIFVIIPAYNEQDALPVLLNQLSTTSFLEHHNIRSLVVDNNSSDETFTIARQNADFVIRECRRGYGQAVHSGMLEAKRMGADILVVLDADGSDDPQYIPHLLEPILSQNADFVLGQRNMKAEVGALTTMQKYGNRFACHLMRIVVGRQYRDLGSFRAITVSAFERLQLQDSNYGWNIEMQIKAVQKKLRIVELDVPYKKRIAGDSKISGNKLQAIKAGYIIINSVMKYGISS